MQRKYWRRVYGWTQSRGWYLISDDWRMAWNAFECSFGAGWCNMPEPYIYEQWWSYTPSTYGSGGDDFHYLGARINWGSNPVVN